ncbi:hypothetical protein MMC07_007507 [Pseudocyphellaria aurata]|nr:hypothetical protein [Pseudocyphellaria aurata]
MAPSPAAGKTPVNPPKTPTKAGRNPSSSNTSKLGQSQSAADSPKNTAKSATNTPKSAPKGLGDKAKASAPGKSDTSSPSLPPRPKEGNGPAAKAKGATPKAPKPEEAVKDVKDKGEEAKGKVDDVKEKGEDVKEDEGSKIDLKDNDPADEADNEDTDAPPGKVSQGGNETGAEEESSAISSAGDLEDAPPEPIDDDDEATAGAEDTPEDETDVPGTDDVQGTADDVTKGAKEKAGGATDKAEGVKGKAGGATDKAEGVKGKAGGATDKVGGATDKGDSVKGKAGDATEKVGGATDKAKGQAGGAKDKARGLAGGLASKASGAKDTAGKAAQGDANGATEDAKGGLEDTAGDAKKGAEDVADDAKDEAEDVAEDAQEGVEDAKDGAEDAAGDVQDDVDDVKDKAEDDVADGVDDVKDTAEDGVPDVDGVDDAVDDAKDAAEDAKDAAEGAAPDVDGVDEAVGDAKDTADDAKDTAEDAAPDLDDAEDAVDEVRDTASDAADQVPVDLSVLKGLEVGEGGEILGPDGEPLGQLDEGDPEDLVGKTIGDDGEILDEDGDVIGRASVLPDKAKELADQAKEDLPDIAVLDGLEVGEDGDILGADGTPLGKIVDGDPKDLVGLKLNEKGEIVDADGDVVGRAEVVPGDAADVVNDAEDALPDVEVLEGLKVGEEGEILGDDDKPLGKIVEGDLEDLIGQEINENGEILNEDGDVIGKAEVVPGEAADKLNEAKDEVDIDELNDELKPDFTILDGKKINKKGNILDDEGEIIGKLTEDSDLKQCVGKKPNENGEILDDDGEVVGRVEIVDGEAADEAMKELNPELVEKLENAVEAAEKAAAEAAKPDLSILDGLRVNKKGEVLNEDGEPIGRLVEGEIKDTAGKKINDNGEVLDNDGNVIGKVEVIPQEVEAAEDAAKDAEGAAEDAEGAAEDAEGAADKAEGAVEEAKSTLPDLSVLDGLKVNKKGEVVNEDGDPIARVSEGEIANLTGKKINDKGEVLDSDGNVLGKVELIPQEVEEGIEDEATPELPPLSILDGLKVNKKGEVVNEEGDPIARVSEGEIDDLAGKKINDKGEVLDSDGNVIGKVELIPQEVEEGIEDDATPELPPLSILDGLKVNKKGEVVNEEGDPIARVSEGEIDDLAGKKINDKGEVLDSDGNVIGKVELIPQEADDEIEDDTPELPPLSILEGLKCNKSGKIINADGTPVGELIEGDAKKLSKSGIQLDAEGQFWDDKGHVIGRAQTLPQDDAEEEATFAGLEGLIVVKDGFVEDVNENKVGILTEGDANKLVGRAVDEDGDVLDKHGNVVGHAERYEEPPAIDPDTGLPPLSILQGLKCNKSGKIVDADGKTVGELIEGDAKKLSKSGNKCDAEGQFWDDQGHVIGKAKTLPQEDDEEEATFAGLEGLIVVQDGFVEDINENKVGIITEGEPKKLVGRAVDEDGDVLDKRGNVVGHAERYEEPPEEDPDSGLPPLSILEGLKCNKAGKLVNSEGKTVGELVEGDAKKISKSGAQCDGEGQFWDSKGNVVGKAKTLPQIDDDEEGAFAGLEGLVVVEDGFVEDINENKVGILTEGDPNKLVGRAVDEDGDVLDKRGNVVGHAERYAEPEPEPEVKADLSILKGLTVNKQGNVIGLDGVPIARVAEGNVKEMAGKKCDEEGQVWNDAGKVIGRCELIPDQERDTKLEGPFAGREGLVVVKDGMVEDAEGNTVGKVVEGDPKKLVGRLVDEDGDIIDKYGNVKGHAEPYEEPEVEEEVIDLSSLEGKTVNKAGNVVDEHGTVYGRVVSGDPVSLAGRKVDGKGQIWSENGKVVGQAELIPGGDRGKADGPFAGFEGLVVVKDGLVQDVSGQIVGKLAEGNDPVKLRGRRVDEDGDILDNQGNSIGKAERYTPEEKERRVSPMSGRKVNKEGEVRDEDGNVIGKLTEGDLGSVIGCEIDDNGYVIDNDGNRIGRCTMLENIQPDEPEPEEEEEGPSEEELAAMKKAEEDNELAKKMNSILKQTLDRIEPVCKQITERIEVADRTPKEELDEEQLVQDVKPLIEEGGRILQECNGAIRGLDPDGRIAANAKARAANREATPEEYALADSLKELTTTVVKTIDNAKKRIADMPHAKKGLNPLWGLLTEPLFQIIAAVGLLLAGVLGLVGKLLNGLGLGGLVNGLLGGLGIDKLLGGLGLGSITEALGFGGSKKKKK